MGSDALEYTACSEFVIWGWCQVRLIGRYLSLERCFLSDTRSTYRVAWIKKYDGGGQAPDPEPSTIPVEVMRGRRVLAIHQKPARNDGVALDGQATTSAAVATAMIVSKLWNAALPSVHAPGGGRCAAFLKRLEMERHRGLRYSSQWTMRLALSSAMRSGATPSCAGSFGVSPPRACGLPQPS